MKHLWLILTVLRSIKYRPNSYADITALHIGSLRHLAKFVARIKGFRYMMHNADFPSGGPVSISPVHHFRFGKTLSINQDLLNSVTDITKLELSTDRG